MDVTNSPEVKEQMRKDGFVSRAMGAEEFKAEIVRQQAFWKEALKDADTTKK
jgi:tripartite-type tricarboxylate transporter receptor subunit TctC